MGHALQPGFQRLGAQRAPEAFIDGDPVSGRVECLLRKVDRAGANVLVRVEANLFEHARKGRDLHLAVTSSESLGVSSGERFEDLDRDRCEGVGVVVDLDWADVCLLLIPVEPIDVVLRAFVQQHRCGELVHLADHLRSR